MALRHSSAYPTAPEQVRKNSANVGRTSLQKLFDGARASSLEEHVA
jgi:hypothetical protein